MPSIEFGNKSAAGERMTTPARSVAMTSKSVLEYQMRSIEEYADYLAKDNTSDTVLFRGQSEDWPLVPKIGRIETSKPVVESEEAMLESFKLQSRPFLNRVPESEWEWLAIAQHHGLPTRLLDWTEYPLVALWFAVAKPANGEGSGVVWIFKPNKNDFVRMNDDDPYSGERAKVFRPAHVADRIRAQAGYFTVHKYQNKTRRFIPFDKIAIYNPRLVKLLISSDSFSDIRFRLDQYGINESVVFPDLDGLSHHIGWLHSKLSDERHLERTVDNLGWKPPSKG